jgi:hypothetical protein
MSSKKSGVSEVSMRSMTLRASAWVGLDELIAPHALNVIFGTSKMIPRDFLTGSLVMVKPQIFGFLQKHLRDMVGQFKAEGPNAS